ncbi:hypothetical protein Kpol_1028p85 [Vanderwaltozyma polyspora DSM 70294]|uniref:Uncharacterized protein n=1 Tax=Vanderwaltozyma polyspora (strain ATCC 22028 / DSM 70294 / BCRC 21397 / CBS 2163 / NBRC 10782 / NRRL Y-8283 / UCD 57-17) TaxID=436907 RepID=A7TG52_VANPO|nr:uncharacterized protein Kpol_1028p85 [Vanderwaltozyma polyspora DSM 70294]EDO18809.1 hypothetical protein Kpol_1028p85 [Vanderwaltozyma polyspora DSM 70294]
MIKIISEILSYVLILRGFLLKFIAILYRIILITFYYLYSFTSWVYTNSFQKIVQLLDIFLLTPFIIIFKNIIQLFMLPINIPLKLFMGITFNDIIFNVNTWEGIYILITMIQYTTVLLICGCIIGLAFGSSLAVIHSFIKVPSIYIDVPKIIWDYSPSLRPRLQKLITNILLFFKSFIKIPSFAKSYYPPSPVLSTTDFNNDDIELEDLEPTLIKKPNLSNFDRKSVSSKEEALEIASLLPSDFFQKEEPIVSKTPQKRKQNSYTYYHTPIQSPNKSDMYDEEVSSLSNIWDQFDDIPTTLRTDGGMTTLVSNINDSMSTNRDTISIRKVKNKK